MDAPVTPSTGPPGVDDVAGPAAEDRRQRAGRLFDAHGRDLLAYLTRRVGADAAPDLLSDVFVVMVGEDRDLDPARGGERAWLFGIATNLVRRHHRDLVRTDAAVRRAAAAVPVEVPNHAGGVVAHVDAHRHVRDLLDALRSLPDEDRDVLLLVAWGGLTTTEAADALGIPPGTARSRLHRVRRRLRQADVATPPAPARRSPR